MNGGGCYEESGSNCGKRLLDLGMTFHVNPFVGVSLYTAIILRGKKREAPKGLPLRNYDLNDATTFATSSAV